MQKKEIIKAATLTSLNKLAAKKSLPILYFLRVVVAAVLWDSGDEIRLGLEFYLIQWC